MDKAADKRSSQLNPPAYWSTAHRLAVLPHYLYAFPTAPGYISFRQSYNDSVPQHERGDDAGSWFIRQLAEVLENHSSTCVDQDVDLIRALTIVSYKVSAGKQVPVPTTNQLNLTPVRYHGGKQAPTTESSLTKLVYLDKKYVKP